MTDDKKATQTGRIRDESKSISMGVDGPKDDPGCLFCEAAKFRSHTGPANDNN